MCTANADDLGARAAQFDLVMSARPGERNDGTIAEDGAKDGRVQTVKNRHGIRVR